MESLIDLDHPQERSGISDSSMSDVGSTFVTLEPLPLAERRAVGGPVSRRLLPPGPRPKQAQLYPRQLGLAEAFGAGVGVEALALGVLLRVMPVARAGGILVFASAVATVPGTAFTWGRQAPADGLR